MDHRLGALTRPLTPILRTVYKQIMKAKSKHDVQPVLESAMTTLLQVRNQVLDTKELIAAGNSGQIDECLLFDTALANVGFAINFMQLNTITPRNKPKLERFVLDAYLHMKKSRDKFYR